MVVRGLNFRYVQCVQIFLSRNKYNKVSSTQVGVQKIRLTNEINK